MKKLAIPTFGDLLSKYPEIAAVERVKSDKPSVSTVYNILSGVRRILQILGIDTSRCINILTYDKIDLFLIEARRLGLSMTTAWTYAQHLQGLVAKWTIPYYERYGWKVGGFRMPIRRRKAARYCRPDRKDLLRVRDWYESLFCREDKREWLIVTLMLEFAMRNGDIVKLRWSDFKQKGDSVYLCYTPHKTEGSSGRIVCWPVHKDIWKRMALIKDGSSRTGTHFQGLVVSAAREVFRRLNKEIKEQSFFVKTHKGLYELRKICIDHIYQKYGAELAVSISGDDIKTISRYYADPSQPNVGAVRIIDLL